MKKFPGKIALVKFGRTRRLVLDREQEEWFRRWFPVTENCRLAEAMGIGDHAMRRVASEMGLEKSAKGLAAMKKRQVAKARMTNIRNGCYDRKRGRPVSAATVAGRDKRWADEKNGLRENARVRMKKTDPEKYRVWSERNSLERKESIRKEKLRLLYGLPRQTNLKAVVMCPYKESQRHHRYNAVKRGYVLAEDCSEGSPYRYKIFYDEETQRNAVFEKNCINDGFSIEKW